MSETSVVLVHGIGQEHKSSDFLESSWIPALIGGVRSAGFFEIAENLKASPSQIRMAFYGDLFLDKGRQGQGKANLQLTGLEQALMFELAASFVESAEANSSKEATRRAAAIARVNLSPAIGAQGVGLVARRLIEILQRVPGLTAGAMDRAGVILAETLSQVSTYLLSPQTRACVLERVQNCLTSETKILIGHSLGSVVAYECCHKLQHPLDLLITLGSPLGLEKTISRRLPSGAFFPPLVRRWVNIADSEDFVAGNPDLTKEYSRDKPVDSTFLGLQTISNGSKPHFAEYYLGKALTGKEVATTLGAR